MQTQLFIVTVRGHPPVQIEATPKYTTNRQGGTKYVPGRDVAKAIVGHRLVDAGAASTFFSAVNMISSCVVAPGQRRPYPKGVKRPRRYGKDI